MTSAQAHRSLQQLLERARTRGSQFGVELSWYATQRLVHRLEQSRVRGTLLLSGDFLIHALLGGEEPFDATLELVWLGLWSERAIRTALRALARVELPDEMEFDIEGARLWPFASSGGRLSVDVALEARLDGAACLINLTFVQAARTVGSVKDLNLKDTLQTLPGTRPLGLAPATLVAERIVDLVRGGIAALQPKAYLDAYVLVIGGAASDADVAAALIPAMGQSSCRTGRGLPSAFSEEAAVDEVLNDMWLALLARRGVAVPALGEVIGTLRRRVEVWLGR